mgnify:CR=1 FL=1
MAGVAFITGKRGLNGTISDCFYMGSVQNDGYAYFNDDKFWRCRTDGSYPQVWYPVKNNWIATTDITDINVLAFDVSGILGTIGGLVGGNGSVSPNASVEAAVQWGVNEVQSRYITYSQSNRWGPNSYDCSSFVITMFRKGGFNINASYTGDMRSGFTAAGFVWHPSSDGNLPASILQRGDIMLNESRHTQVYIGNNQDVNCGSTPARVVSHNKRYTYGGANGWDGFLRYGA